MRPAAKNGSTDRHALWIEDLRGPKKPCIRRGSGSPPWEEAVLRVEGADCCKLYGHSAASCTKTAKTINMPFGIWTRVGQRNHVLDGDPHRPMRMHNFRGKDMPGYS